MFGRKRSGSCRNGADGNGLRAEKTKRECLSGDQGRRLERPDLSSNALHPSLGFMTAPARPGKASVREIYSNGILRWVTSKNVYSALNCPYSFPILSYFSTVLTLSPVFTLL